MQWRLFEGIPGEDVRAVLALARRSTYRRGEVVFFDVLDKPPKRGAPASPPGLSFKQFVQQVVGIYDARNKPPFEWADD